MRCFVLLLAPLLSACALGSESQRFVPAEEWSPANPTLQDTARTFQEVSRRVGAAASTECRRQTNRPNCTFGILVDLDRNAPTNAFQTLDDSDRPFIIFTQSMILAADNGDEMAFVMGHEAAHHVLGHIDRQAENAKESARIFGDLARDTGANAEEIEQAQQLGAEVGVQTYVRDFELEADRLGTVITYQAGYNPLVGMEFFKRIPDPGDRFLASHPPNARRVQVVLETAAKLGLTQ